MADFEASIVLAGVGGQGTLIAGKLLGILSLKLGLDVKVSEVHGMSQRGGDVQSHLRLSTDEIWSDLIPHASADLVISMEPMESLRYLAWLSASGTVVTSSKPFVNIPDYPAAELLQGELAALPSVVSLDIEQIARDLSSPRSANMVLLGMAAPYIGILQIEQLRDAIITVFSRKGQAVVEANLKAFDAGVAAASK